MEGRRGWSQIVMAFINWATHVLQRYNKKKQKRKLEQIYKQYHNSDYRLQFAYMKMESLVIVNQHVTVNSYLDLAQTARHIKEMKLIRNSYFLI